MSRVNYKTEAMGPAVSTAHRGILIACRIAQSFSQRLPTPAQLQSEFGMSRATAYRWVHALRLVRQEAAAREGAQ